MKSKITTLSGNDSAQAPQPCLLAHCLTRQKDHALVSGHSGWEIAVYFVRRHSCYSECLVHSMLVVLLSQVSSGSLFTTYSSQFHLPYPNCLWSVVYKCSDANLTRSFSTLYISHIFFSQVKDPHISFQKMFILSAKIRSLPLT